MWIMAVGLFITLSVSDVLMNPRMSYTARVNTHFYK